MTKVLVGAKGERGRQVMRQGDPMSLNLVYTTWREGLGQSNQKRQSR